MRGKDDIGRNSGREGGVAPGQEVDINAIYYNALALPQIQGAEEI